MRRRIVATLASVTVLMTGCTLDEGSGSAEAGSGSIEKIDALDGVTLKVGSKEFDEQLVLGQIARLVIQAAGGTAEDKTNITGSDNVRKALESGDIDLYWEYTGTAWVSFLKKNEDVDDPAQLYKKVAAEDAKKDVTWWAQSPANNTYAIAANADAAKEHNVKTVSDYAKLTKSDPKSASTCMGPEFRSRDDGFAGLQKAYKFKLPGGQIHEVGDALVYTETGKGETCDFGSVATTDGRIPAQKLQVLEDDKKFFPVYNPAVTIRSELAEKYPELEQAFAAVAEKLTDEELLSLNEKVSVESQDPKKVATDWMKEQGFTG